MYKNFVPLDSIDKKLFKVSEEILDKNIDNFILHNLKEETKLKNSSDIFYSYLNFTKEYFICYYQNIDNSFNIIDLIIIYLKNKELDNKRVLVYFEDYFLLFNHSQFYYFQKIEKELISQDINEYIEKRLMFEVEDSCHLYSFELKDLCKKKSIKSSLNHLKDRSTLKIYYSYLMILFFLGFSFVGYDYYHKTLVEKEKALKLENKIKQNTIKSKDTLYNKISLLFNEIEESNLKIRNLNLIKNTLKMTIILNNSVDAYTFLEKHKNIKLLSFKKIKDCYEISSEITF